MTDTKMKLLRRKKVSKIEKIERNKNNGGKKWENIMRAATEDHVSANI